jgi:EAL domain-containing protein (putative c-di-GMP-specific phosphodiesterase class I)
LALSEDIELIVGLMRWTLRQGCLHAQALSNAGLPALFCIICVPPRMLMRRELCADVRAALDESGLAPKRLILVLQLDRYTVEVADLLDLATELQQLGVLLVLGGMWDAGLPLQYLQALPLTALRLEPRFLHRLGSDPKALGLCEGLTGLSHSLGLQIIADGVETAGDLAMMRRLGCDLACGGGVTWPGALDLGQSPLLQSLQQEGGMMTSL